MSYGRLGDNDYCPGLPKGPMTQRARLLLCEPCGNWIAAQGGYQVNMVLPGTGLGRVISDTNPVGPNSQFHVIYRYHESAIPRENKAIINLLELKPVFWWKNLHWNNKMGAYVTQAYVKGVRIYARPDRIYEDYLFKRSCARGLTYVTPFPHDLPDTKMEFIFQSGSDKIYFDKETGWLDTNIERFKWKEVSEPQTKEYIEMVEGIRRKHPSQYFKYNQQQGFFY